MKDYWRIKQFLVMKPSLYNTKACRDKGEWDYKLA